MYFLIHISYSHNMSDQIRSGPLDSFKIFGRNTIGNADMLTVAPNANAMYVCRRLAKY